MRRVVITVEDTLPNGKYIAESMPLVDNDFIWKGNPESVARNLMQKLDNRLWIEGTGDKPRGLMDVYGPLYRKAIENL